MGLSPSKRVETILQNSPEFDTACNSVYEECLNLTQHAFSGVLPYQLSDASTRLHLTLSTANPLVKKWVPLPPARIQIDKALEIVIERFKVDSRGGGGGGGGGEETLDSSEFKAFAIELFKDSIVSNAGKAVLQRVPIGIAGIAGVGIVTRSGKDLVGTFMGVYALGVVTAVYLNLS